MTTQSGLCLEMVLVLFRMLATRTLSRSRTVFGCLWPEVRFVLTRLCLKILFPVLTECTGARCEEKTELRLSGNDDFYIDQSQGQGQIFLISNNGDTNINQVCSAPCSLTLTAHLENTQPAQLTLQVESSHYR